MLTHECKGNASYKHLSIKQENIDLYYKNKPRIFATVPKEKKEEEEEDLRPFRIHAYSKEELAMLYNPTYCISNAIYTLAAWIRHNKALKGELEKVGYNKYRRTFTPLEVKVLVKYLGEP